MKQSVRVRLRGHLKPGGRSRYAVRRVVTMQPDPGGLTLSKIRALPPEESQKVYEGFKASIVWACDLSIRRIQIREHDRRDRSAALSMMSRAERPQTRSRSPRTACTRSSAASGDGPDDDPAPPPPVRLRPASARVFLSPKAVVA